MDDSYELCQIFQFYNTLSSRVTGFNRIWIRNSDPESGSRCWTDVLESWMISFAMLEASPSLCKSLWRPKRKYSISKYILKFPTLLLAFHHKKRALLSTLSYSDCADNFFIDMHLFNIEIFLMSNELLKCLISFRKMFIAWGKKKIKQICCLFLRLTEQII